MQIKQFSRELRHNFPVSYGLMKMAMGFFFAGVFGVLLVMLSISIESKPLQITGTFCVGVSVFLGMLVLIFEIPVGIYEVVKRKRNRNCS